MKKKIIVGLLAALMITSLAACQNNNQNTGTSDQSAQSAVSVEKTSDNTSNAKITSDNAGNKQSLPDVGEVVTTANVTSNGAIDASSIFSDRDLRQNPDTTDAEYFTLSDSNDVTITSEGVYVFTGSASNTSIIVEAGDSDKVQIVLNGVSISNTSTPAIYVKSADKVFVTTVSGTDNSLSVTGSFTADGTTNTDAVIFSKDDLVLNGLGTLNIHSTDNGISGKDDIKITGGTINIDCSSDAIEANDSIVVADGTLKIDTGKDGLHAENDEDNAVGYIYICGGTFDITAGSDGIQATTVAQIDGGTVTISGSEGIEGTYVQINGGTINISAFDDGINASSKSTAFSVTVEINGGDITINMGQGDTDGIDVNGNLYINGGTVNVSGQSPFDYDGEGKLNGGTVIVNGSQTTELTNQMMGGGMGGNMGGGMGDMRGGGLGGNMGGMPDTNMTW